MKPSPDVLDIRTNRASSKYDRSVMARRILWMLCGPLFRYSPRPCFGWRRAMLRAFGASIGKHVHIHNSVTIVMPWNLTVGDWSAIGEHVYIYNLGSVTIGEQVSVSYRAHLCAGSHDFTKPDLPLIKPSITIEDSAWVCTDTFVAPGVRIGQGAVAGARAVVTRDVPPWSIVVGNPAKAIGTRQIAA